MIVGLAPAANGANRTGRVFTGDRSGDVLYAAMHRAGLANSPISVDAADGLTLNGTRVVAAVRCAPPDNAPTPAERATCAPWLTAEWRLTGGDVRVIVALGGFGWRSSLDMVRSGGGQVPRPQPKFGHGAAATVRAAHGEVVLLGCYHPSQQNTFTGKLTTADARRCLRPGRGDRRTIRMTAGVDVVMRLSVLDLVPVRTDQTTADALAATVRLAQTADRLGFTRYWLAEHHNMPSVGATSPPVLIAYLAAQTSQLRLGSGGVMLPNHAPLAVAEQFALLEAAAPGRIDLGIGRAPGSDPVTSILLRGAAGRDDRDIDQFPEYLDHVRAMMSARGVPVQLRDGDYILKATPAAASEPRLWLLGSSMYSARLAAAKGLPYVFAHHFSGKGTEEALALYRSQFVPSELAAEPVTFLTVNAAVAETRDEATALMLPNLHMMARLRTGQPLGPLELVEDARRRRTDTRAAAHRQQRTRPRGPRDTRRGRRTTTRAGGAVRRRRGDGAPGRVGAPRHRSCHRSGSRDDAGAAGQGAVLAPGDDAAGSGRDGNQRDAGLAATSSSGMPRSGCCCSC